MYHAREIEEFFSITKIKKTSLKKTVKNIY